jgi:hypothetical protein
MATKWLNITPGRLIMMDWKAKETAKDIKEGRKSFSKSEPLLVSYFPDEKKYLIMDGHHRAMELLSEGHKEFTCIVAEHQPKIYNIEYTLVTLKAFCK